MGVTIGNRLTVKRFQQAILNVQYALTDFIRNSFTTLAGVSADLSGIAYSPVTNTLFSVSNGTPVMYEHSLEGNLLRTITMTNFYDAEGICHMYGNTFAVSQERTAAPYIIIFTISPGQTNVDRLNGTTITPNITITNNAGMEGITYNLSKNSFYVAVEKQANGASGGRVFEVEMNGSATLLTSLTNSLISAGNTDLADIYYDNSTKKIHLLSQEIKRITQCTLDGVLLNSISLSEFAQPEGMTIMPDGSRLIVVGEPNQIAYYSKA